MENKCRIVFTRPKEWVNRMRNFSILVDGHKLASISSGGSQELTVEPGAHKISVKVDWCGSREYPLQLAPGKTAYLRIKNGMKYYMPLAIPMVAVLLLNLYYTAFDFKKPDWLPYVLIAGVVPAALYIVYYLTLGRKDYLVIDTDPTFSAA